MVEAEKEFAELIQVKNPKAVLTKLFIELKTDKTSAIIERKIEDIDAVVREVRLLVGKKNSANMRFEGLYERKVLLKHNLL